MGKHSKTVKCAMCHGTGKIMVSKNGSDKQEARNCSRCNGTGQTA